MSESLNQPEKINTAANQRKTDLEIGEKKTNFLKHPDQILNIIRTTLSSKGLWLFIVPISIYLSFFIIILITFLLFKPSNTSPQNTNQTNQSLTEEQKKQIAEEVNKVITTQQKTSSRQKAVSENPNSILAKGYIDGQIKQEAQEQAEKVVKDEIDKLKADWKGDLFGQISFPVIFAIASIFAAFAVKDILTEILKQEEKEKVKRELEQDLILMISETVETNPVLVQRLQCVEAYTSWLEHELLKITINQVLEELEKKPESFSEENLHTLEKLLSRVKVTLNEANKFKVGRFKESHLRLLEEAESRVFQAKVDSVNLDKDFKERIILSLNQEVTIAGEHPSKLIATDPNERMDSIFQIQINLLIATLSKLPGTEDLITMIRDVLARESVYNSEMNAKRVQIIKNKPRKNFSDL
ncbi:hypothetical protein ACN4EK_14235 [Pantanalinema rosaneae CENA516]|uniref:hypothetical protein n=1 Tax=Pantanalinema rosaneae TaxID=1620701 RepID=UPI003D6E2B70